MTYGARKPHMFAAAFVMPYIVPANLGLRAMWFIWLPAYTAPANAPGKASNSCTATRSHPTYATPNRPRDGTIEAANND
jgi:hypothetical protein